MRVMLLADTPNWAFDHIAKGFIKYNKFPDIHYEIVYVDQIDRFTYDYAQYDLVYDMFWSNQFIPAMANVIKGCYSSRWRDHNEPLSVPAGILNRAAGVVFANNRLQAAFPEIKHSVVIRDSADPSLFWTMPYKSTSPFNALFVGRGTDKVKQLDLIKQACLDANVDLVILTGTPHDELIGDYNAANVVINFSKHEGGPQIVPEAALCGTPVLMPTGVGMEFSAGIIRFDDYNGLVKLLKLFKEDPDTLNKHGAEARLAASRELTYIQASEQFGNFAKDTFARL